MSENRPASDRASWYARRVERRWSELVDQPVLLSPRDWARITSWHERGIPLEIVEEAMIEALERDRRRSSPRRLADLAPLVEQAWAAIVDGRRAEAEIGDEPERALVALDFWMRRADAEPPESPLGGLLRELVGRGRGGGQPAELDRELDRRLPEVVDPALLRRVERETDEELAPYRGRMSAECLESTRRRASAARLRRKLDLPRLAEREGAT